MMNSSVLKTFALMIAGMAGLALASCAEDRLPAAGVITLSDLYTGDYALIDQNGDAVSSEQFKGKVQLVYFGFATCPDVCPMALGRMSAALNELPKSARNKIVPVFITVDPERDTPDALKAYLQFDDRILGLTGSPEAAKTARESFKVYASKVELPDSAAGYTMDHASHFFVVDRAGNPIWALEDTLDPSEIAIAARKALKK